MANEMPFQPALPRDYIEQLMAMHRYFNRSDMKVPVDSLDIGTARDLVEYLESALFPGNMVTKGMRQSVPKTREQMTGGVALGDPHPHPGPLPDQPSGAHWEELLRRSQEWGGVTKPTDGFVDISFGQFLMELFGERDS
jgi:hypothetical protein